MLRNIFTVECFISNITLGMTVGFVNCTGLVMFGFYPYNVINVIITICVFGGIDVYHYPFSLGADIATMSTLNEVALSVHTVIFNVLRATCLGHS